MGEPARKLDARGARKRGRRLRVVRGAPKPGRQARPGRAKGVEARTRAAFGAVMVVLVAMAALGMARVAVIARATEMTISADRLMGDIAAERVEAGKLEVDRSSLSTPSRLESIAKSTMGMSRPSSVKYIRMDEPSASGKRSAKKKVETASTSSTGESGGLLAALMDMSAGEAASLLVGDMGLAGAR